jgi:hypothetical protein
MVVRAESSSARQLYLYFGILTFLIFLDTPEILLDIPTSYILKDHLHATASQVSMFRLLTGIPLYIGFAFGLVRDLWNPFGWRDPGYFRIFVPLTVSAFAWMAFSHLSYSGLLAGMILAMLSSRFVMSAYQGLIALLAQETLMSGRLSALSNIFNFAPQVAVTFASGYVAEHLSSRQTFSLAIALTLPIGLFGFGSPALSSTTPMTIPMPWARISQVTSSVW